MPVQTPLQLIGRSEAQPNAPDPDAMASSPDARPARASLPRVAMEWRAAWDPHSGLDMPGTSLRFREGRARMHRLYARTGAADAASRPDVQLEGTAIAAV